MLLTLAAGSSARYQHAVVSIWGLLGACVVVLGSALALAACNHDDECASADDCSSPGMYAGFGGNVDAGARAPNLTGDEPGQACIIGADLCEWHAITTDNDAASLSSLCKLDEYDVATDCPTKDLGGCCATPNVITCYYNAPDLPAEIRKCEGLHGTWRVGAP